MNAILPLYIFISGAILGSFFNVVGLRLPKKIDFTKSRSACPHCSTTLQARDLIPLISFLLSKGKCRHCESRISIAYPIVELSTGILFLSAYMHLGMSYPFIGACLLISLAIIVTVGDLKYMIIPDRLLLFFAGMFIIYRFFYPLEPWYVSILGALTGFGLIMLIIVVSKGGMGGGDMKLFGILGILLGVKMTLLTFFLATIIGTIASLLLLGFKVIGRKDPFPFGPSIMLASILSYLYGYDLLNFYFETFYI